MTYRKGGREARRKKLRWYLQWLEDPGRICLDAPPDSVLLDPSLVGKSFYSTSEQLLYRPLPLCFPYHHLNSGPSPIWPGYSYNSKAFQTWGWHIDLFLGLTSHSTNIFYLHILAHAVPSMESIFLPSSYFYLFFKTQHGNPSSEKSYLVGLMRWPFLSEPQYSLGVHPHPCAHWGLPTALV